MEEFEKLIKKIFDTDCIGCEDALSEKIRFLESDELSQDELFFVAAASKSPQYENFQQYIKDRK